MAPSPRILAAIDLLAPRAGEHLLEVGCGTGQAIEACLFRIPDLKIHAIDRSATAVARAGVVNAEAISRGQVTIDVGDIDRGPVNGTFDRIFAIRVNSFWMKPGPAVRHVGTSLKPGGSIWIIFDGPADKTDGPIAASLADEGYADIHTMQNAGAHAWIGVRRP